MRPLAACNARRGLGGFGHLPQYTLIKTLPGLSYHRDVMNRFAGFKSFAERRGEGLSEGKKYPVLNESERSKRRDRSTTQRHAHHHSREDITQKVHSQHNAGHGNAQRQEKKHAF